MMGEKMKIKSFTKLFEEAKRRDAYWVLDAIYTFTEELHSLAEHGNINRTELARSFGGKPGLYHQTFSW